MFDVVASRRFVQEGLRVPVTVDGEVSKEWEIASYVQCGEGVGKAGGYAIQGRAEIFVKSINGSYSNVVGLPLNETVALLRGLI